MNRRKYLAGVAAVLGGSAAGCLEANGESTTMDYETHGLRHHEPVIEGGVPLADAPPEDERTVHLITTEAGTDRFDESVLDEEATAFVEEVEVTSVEQSDDRATARVDVTYPSAGDTAIAYETTLVRVSLDGKATPDSASVTFDLDGTEKTVTTEE
ncbi:hypothetical protein BRC81_08580 [Halobacteriales archaeon QS_1_68_20]|nr:MAG: hypothetical protein BRC81_08580 [Halobacteriales archaeon QS_1_68_20]